MPSAVRERLLVTFMMQQQELQQEMKQQQYKLEQELRERSQWQLAAKEAQHLVHNRTTELLVLKGCMNLRGVLEFAENEAKKFGGPNQSRFGLWKWILKQKPDLKSCIHTATSWDEQTIPGKIQSLYDTLNKHHHIGKTPAEWRAVGGLRIEEGAKIYILDCRLLACICASHGIKAEAIPKVDEYSDSDTD